MTRDPLPVHAPDAAAAAHGQWCPKLCSHTCPVLRATERVDAVPWSFHRTVADLAEGRLAPDDAAGRLVACTGCRACAGGCEVAGQDVPAQVRAGRAAVVAAGAAPPAVEDAVTAARAGRSPFGTETAGRVGATRIDAVLVAGCRDAPGTVAAAVRLLAAAGEVVEVVVPRGCCGAVLRDLGATGAADDAGSLLDAALDVEAPVLLLDPHCRAEVVAAGAVEVVDLVVHLGALVADGRLDLHGPGGTVRWHEPCVLRGTAAAGEGRAVLAASGALVELPGETHHGCSGAGLGLPLLDPDTSRAVAAARVDAFTDTGPLVTACSGAATLLATADEGAVHLVDHLASLLDHPPESVA